MKHKFIRVEAIRLLGRYEVELRFADGVIRTIDFEPVLIGPFFGELRDEEMFSKAYLDRSVGTIAWPNGADFDPDTIYRWDEVAGALRDQLRSA